METLVTLAHGLAVVSTLLAGGASLLRALRALFLARRFRRSGHLGAEDTASVLEDASVTLPRLLLAPRSVLAALFMGIAHGGVAALAAYAALVAAAALHRLAARKLAARLCARNGSWF